MILSCGEALIDLVPHAVPGGGPMNVAITAARLGGPGAFLGRVSTDAYGDQVWAHLTRNAVDLRYTQRGPEPTATAEVIVGPPLRFVFHGDGTADQALEPVDADVLGAAGQIIHGGTLGLFRGRTAEVLADLVEQSAGLVSLDPNIRPQLIDDRAAWEHFHDRWLRKAKVYKSSDEDFDWIWPDRSPDSVAEELLASGLELVIVTRGGDGASFFHRSGEHRGASYSIEPVDTVGAGDAFMGSVLVSLWEAGAPTSAEVLPALSADDIAEIADRAAICAAMTCLRAGADPPTREEIRAGRQLLER